MSELIGVNALGGFSATASIDATLRQRATKQTYCKQMTLKMPSFGPNRSASILFDKVGRAVTALNVAGIGETDDVPQTNFPWVQGTVTVTEYANAIGWTEKLERLSQFPIGPTVAAVLRQDQIEGLDKVAAAAYATGRQVYTPTTASSGVMSTTGTASVVAGSLMTTSHVKDITDYLRVNAVPAGAGGRYWCICHVDHARGIKDSNDFFASHVYKGQEMIFDHEIGEYADVRFIEENNALLSPAGTNTVSFAQAFYFGADHIVEAVAVAEHIRYALPTMMGRTRSEYSYFIGGFSLVWGFNTDGGEEHGVRADSL